MASSEFLQAYVAEMSKYTDAPAIFHRANAYTMLSSIFAEREYRYYIDGGVPYRWPNLWTMLIGDSGGPRKSTTVHMMLELLNVLYPQVKGPDEMTPEGLAAAMQKRAREEHELAANMFLVYPEMSTALSSAGRDFNASFKPMLLDFFDTKPEYRKQLSTREFMVKRPRISILGAISTELLPKYTDGTDWLGGFMSRFIVIRGVTEKEKPLPNSPSSDLYRGLANKANALLKAWKKTRKVALAKAKADGEQRLVWMKLSKDAKKMLLDLPPPEHEHLDYNMSLVLSRADLHLRRIAAIAQIDSDPESLEIGKDAMLRARDELWDQWRADVPDLVAMCYARGREDFEGDRLPRRMIRVLSSAGERGATFAELLRSCGLDVQQLSNGVMALVAAELATETNVEGTDGRGPQRLIKLLPKGQAMAAQVLSKSDDAVNPAQNWSRYVRKTSKTAGKKETEPN